LKKNSGYKVEIGAYIDKLVTDSIPSNDLTEVIADTIYYELKKEDLLSDEKTINDQSPETDDPEFTETDSTEQSDIFEFKEDSLSSELDDSEEDIFSDVNLESDGNAFLISPEDSLIAVGYEIFEETDDLTRYIKINYTYHNDRTQKQAEALLQELTKNGVPSNLLEAKGYGANWAVDRATEERNYWIELKLLPD